MIIHLHLKIVVFVEKYLEFQKIQHMYVLIVDPYNIFNVKINYFKISVMFVSKFINELYYIKLNYLLSYIRFYVFKVLNILLLLK